MGGVMSASGEGLGVVFSDSIHHGHIYRSSGNKVGPFGQLWAASSEQKVSAPGRGKERPAPASRCVIPSAATIASWETVTTHSSRAAARFASADSAKRVVGLSGTCLRLWPPKTLAKNIESVQWKRPGPSPSEFSVILTWKCESDYCSDKNWTLNHLNKRFGFTTQNLSLTIQAAQQQDSGFYIFEATDEHGKVKDYTFQVSVFDHVGEPHVLQDSKVLEGGRCQVTLSCSVPSGGNVSYDWYRGSVLIETARNHSTLEDQIDANSSHIYTCNVSNSVSWTNRTFILHCPGDSQQDKSLHLLVIIVVLLIMLFLGALTGFCVWRRKMKQSQDGTEEFLTVYEDVNNVQIKRNQEQKPNSPGEGSTIYSMIQSQPSASTSQEANTLYALVQPSRKSESKKKNHGPSLNNTIYEEVGKRQLKAQNPARLSRRELENFSVYS